MSSRSILISVDTVSKSLPFGVDEYVEVNRAYRRWVEKKDPGDRRIIEIWTYCFVQRYFAIQFLRSSEWMRSDADRLIDRTLRRLRRSSGQLRNPDRYTSWVVSICRNSYLTYVRGHRIGELADPDSVVSEPLESVRYDVSTMYRALEAGIERLPEFLQEIARMRLIEGRPYRQISAVTGRDIPTLRSYASRALAALRQDRLVRQVFDEMRP